ncbi:MAG: ketol-acid reductoisomerase [Candidatus Lokiarchaeota archaeon]|nr:ketol-acid reductoisomerase [Candidatus Lokiarchaeota archaeon]MBD3200419.1 ketol-acid reductoisomerase [Candidatus Lokiarchaeota archaeon]
MVNIYHENDGDLNVLKGKTIAIVGYGNQGRAQALNLRDSGLNVIVGNRDDDYKSIAQEDEFETFSIQEAVKEADVVFILIPDEIMQDVFESSIKPNLTENDAIVFASGYNVGFDLLNLPENIDILLLAPRMIGVGVREKYLDGEGFFSFIAVHQDHSNNALQIILALSKGVGTLKKGAIEVTFKMEAELDLFNEQGFGPAFGRVLLSAIHTLIDAGYPPEAVLVEMYMSGEMSYTYQAMAKVGLVKQVNFHSQTSQYGSMSRGIRFRKLPLKPKMEEILEEIQSGEFTKEWEKSLTKLKFKLIKFFATKQKINRIENEVRESLGLKEYDVYEGEPPTEEEMKELKEISEELKVFEKYYK